MILRLIRRCAGWLTRALGRLLPPGHAYDVAINIRNDAEARAGLGGPWYFDADIWTVEGAAADRVRLDAAASIVGQNHGMLLGFEYDVHLEELAVARSVCGGCDTPVPVDTRVEEADPDKTLWCGAEECRRGPKDDR